MVEVIYMTHDFIVASKSNIISYVGFILKFLFHLI